MNNRVNFSIRKAGHKVLVAIRKKLNIRPRYTMAEVAQKAGLQIIHLTNKPQDYPGFLDASSEPRFIAVNVDLPAHKQALFIARQIAFRAQLRRYNSLALDRPWKWKMLDAAPEDLKNKILQLDEEYRANWLMLFFSSGDEFRAYVRDDPKKAFWTVPSTDNVILYHLSKLWVKTCLTNFYRKFVFVRYPAS